MHIFWHAWCAARPWDNRARTPTLVTQARNFTEEQMILARAMPARWTNLGRSLDVKESPARGGVIVEGEGGAPAEAAAAPASE